MFPIWCPSVVKEMVSRRRQARHLMLGMLQRHYPLDLVMSTLARALPHFRRQFRSMEAGAREGRPLSELMSRHMMFAPPIVLELLRAGERHNLTPEAMELGCALTEDDILAHRGLSFITYLFYVGLICTMCSLVILVFVLPVFEKMFSDMDMNLPTLTSGLFAAAHGLYHHAPLLLVLTAVLILLAFPLRGLLRGRDILESIPLVGPFIRHTRWWRVLYGAGFLMKRGLPLSDALAVMARATGYRRLLRAADRVGARMAEGAAPADAFGREGRVPELLEWSAAASTPDQLPDLLMRMGELQLARRRAWLSATGPVAMAAGIFCAVSFFGLIVVSLYLPVLFIAGGLL